MMRLIGIETLPTNIMNKTGTSWTTFKSHMKYLTILGYVSEDKCDEYDKRTKFVYKLTPEGRKFLTEYYAFAVNYPVMPQIDDDFVSYKGE
jgi:predicted transcriptional regulator